jgi:predicted amidophosphoribosyltransferase
MKDTSEGQTHFYDDNCGEPAHNEGNIICPNCMAHFHHSHLPHHVCDGLMKLLVKANKNKNRLK